MHPTPLRGRKIARILESGLVWNAIPTYHCGAANGQDIGPLPLALLSLLLHACTIDQAYLDPWVGVLHRLYHYNGLRFSCFISKVSER